MFAARSKLDRALDAFDRRQWRRARKLLLEALAEEENAAGYYHLGLIYWRGLGGGAEPDAATECFERAAERGHAASQTAYAIALRSGIGTERDDEKARALLRSAAGAGDCNAMVELAAMCEAPEDTRRWLLRASELGHAPAMMKLADFILAQEPIEALSWLYAAVALSGDEAARKRAAALALEMTAAEIDAAQKAGRVTAKDIKQRARGK